MPEIASELVESLKCVMEKIDVLEINWLDLNMEARLLKGVHAQSLVNKK